MPARHLAQPRDLALDVRARGVALDQPLEPPVELADRDHHGLGLQRGQRAVGGVAGTIGTATGGVFSSAGASGEAGGAAGSASISAGNDAGTTGTAVVTAKSNDMVLGRRRRVTTDQE